MRRPFRELEHQTVTGLARGQDAVLALGGGALGDKRTRAALRNPRGPPSGGPQRSAQAAAKRSVSPDAPPSTSRDRSTRYGCTCTKTRPPSMFVPTAGDRTKSPGGAPSSHCCPAAAFGKPEVCWRCQDGSTPQEGSVLSVWSPRIGRRRFRPPRSAMTVVSAPVEEPGRNVRKHDLTAVRRPKRGCWAIVVQVVRERGHATAWIGSHFVPWEALGIGRSLEGDRRAVRRPDGVACW